MHCRCSCIQCGCHSYISQSPASPAHSPIQSTASKLINVTTQLSKLLEEVTVDEAHRRRTAVANTMKYLLRHKWKIAARSSPASQLQYWTCTEAALAFPRQFVLILANWLSAIITALAYLMQYNGSGRLRSKSHWQGIEANKKFVLFAFWSVPAWNYRGLQGASRHNLCGF